MAKTESISLYNLNMEKALLDLVKVLDADDQADMLKQRYCMFYPMIGKDYDEKKELMVYGQSVDDWKPIFKLTKNKEQVETIVKKAYDFSIVSRGCALDWVNRYWIKQSLYRSFFWNIVQKLSIEYYGKSEKDWNNIVAYSNLIKIAPYKQDTPKAVLTAQINNSAHLFKEEISLLQPRNVLIVADFNSCSKEVLKAAGIKFSLKDNEYIKATTAYRGSRIIISEKAFARNHRKFLDEVKREMV